MQIIQIFIMVVLFCSGCQKHKKSSNIYQATIYRDNFGVPHVYGKTDADVIFGAAYARAEDEFHYMEQAYIKLSGQVSAIKGKDHLRWDVFVRKLQLVKYSQQEYHDAPKHIQQLCDAFAGSQL